MNYLNYILKSVLYPSIFIRYEIIFYEIHKLDGKTKWNLPSLVRRLYDFLCWLLWGNAIFHSQQNKLQFLNKGFKMYFYHAKVWGRKKQSLENQNLNVEIWQSCSDLLSWRWHVHRSPEKGTDMLVSCHFLLSGSFHPSWPFSVCAYVLGNPPISSDGLSMLSHRGHRSGRPHACDTLWALT